MEFTYEEIIDLTDGELVEVHRFMVAEIERLLPAVLQSAGSIAGLEPMRQVVEDPTFWMDLVEGTYNPSTDEEIRFSFCRTLQRRIAGEMERRLPEMLCRARLTLGLTHRDIGRVAGMHSKFVDEIEQGRRGEVISPGFFERACTDRSLEPADCRLSLSLWFPVADPRICRTIRDVLVDPSWLFGNEGAVIHLARSIREGRSFHVLPVLGDALEEAGCVNPAILDHCRTPGAHARGCWVVDALVRAARRI